MRLQAHPGGLFETRGARGRAAAFACGLILHRRQLGLPRGFVQPRSI